MMEKVRHKTQAASTVIRLAKEAFSVQRLLSYGLRLKALLFYNPLEDATQARKVLAVSLEKGKVTACLMKGTGKSIAVLGKNVYTSPGHGFPSPEEVTTFVGLVMEGKPKKGTRLIIAIPKDWCIVKTADYPLSAQENLSTVISYDMDNLTPFSAAEVFFDYRVIAGQEDRISLAVYAVPRHFVRLYLADLLESGFPVQSVTLNAHALMALCLESGESHGRMKSLCLLSLSGEKAEVALCRHGVLTGLYTLAAADAAGIVSTMEKGMEVYFNYDSGNEETAQRIRSLLSGPSFDLRAVSLPVKESLSSDFAVSVGAFLSETRQETNAVNVLSLGARQRKTLPMALTGFLFVLLTAVIFFILYIPVWRYEKIIGKLDEKINTVKPAVSKLLSLQEQSKKIQEDMSAFNGFLKKEMYPSELLKELTALTPDNAWFIRLEFKDGVVNVDGYAENASSFIGLIEKSRYFKDAQFTSTTVKDPKTNKDRFKIKMNITDKGTPPK